jgi:hypothetical protein
MFKTRAVGRPALIGDRLCFATPPNQGKLGRGKNTTQIASTVLR